MCPLRMDHNAQLASSEGPECVSVVRSGAPSLSTFSTFQVHSAFSSSCPPLFSTLPYSLCLFLACSSVCLRRLSRHRLFQGFSPYKQMQIEIWKKEIEEKALEDVPESQRRMPLEIYGNTFSTNITSFVHVSCMSAKHVTNAKTQESL